MSSNKEILVSTIKEWVDCERNIKDLQRQMKEFKDKKKILNNTLIDVMKNNEIDCFDINGGKILHKTAKVRAPVSKEYLYKVLSDYFGDTPSIDCNQINELVFTNRPVKERHSIVMKENK